MKSILLTISCCVCLTAFSQDYTELRRISDELFKLGLSSFETKNYSQIDGSPYLNSELIDGKIITKNDKVLIGKLRYNVYTDEIEFLYKGSLLSFANPENFKEFYIDNQLLKYYSYLNGKKYLKSFMLVMVNGKYSLLIKKRVDYLSKDKQQPYATPKPDRFESKEDVFYLSYDGQIAKKVTNLKKLIKSFPELKDAIESYPEKKINFDKQEDLIKLVEYINTKLITK